MHVTLFIILALYAFAPASFASTQQNDTNILLDRCHQAMDLLADRYRKQLMEVADMSLCYRYNPSKEPYIHKSNNNSSLKMFCADADDPNWDITKKGGFSMGCSPAGENISFEIHALCKGSCEKSYMTKVTEIVFTAENNGSSYEILYRKVYDRLSQGSYTGDWASSCTKGEDQCVLDVIQVIPTKDNDHLSNAKDTVDGEKISVNANRGTQIKSTYLPNNTRSQSNKKLSGSIRK